jgi:hypothetical protein
VGCTMRLVRGDPLRRLQPHFTVYDGAFGPEMLLLSVIGDWRVVQVPVNYRARSGVPGTTDSFRKALEIGLQMIALVVGYRGRSHRVFRALSASDGTRLRNAGLGEPQPGGEPSHMFPQLRLRRRSSSSGSLHEPR